MCLNRGQGFLDMPTYLGLVGGGQIKKHGKQEYMARDIYAGKLFKLAFQHALETCDDVLILSALHGILPPHQLIAPYDHSTGHMLFSEHRIWGRRVVTELMCLYPHNRLSILFLAGDQYLWPVKEALEREQRIATPPMWEFDTPLEGRGLTGRLDWFKVQVRQKHEEEANVR